jgi:hypothetical protein
MELSPFHPEVDLRLPSEMRGMGQGIADMMAMAGGGVRQNLVAVFDRLECVEKWSAEHREGLDR